MHWGCARDRMGIRWRDGRVAWRESSPSADRGRILMQSDPETKEARKEATRTVERSAGKGDLRYAPSNAASTAASFPSCRQVRGMMGVLYIWGCTIEDRENQRSPHGEIYVQ
jgi:hypothetical protein